MTDNLTTIKIYSNEKSPSQRKKPFAEPIFCEGLLYKQFFQRLIDCAILW